MQDLYVAEDDIWKIINYETQLVKLEICIEKQNQNIS